jgi:hypothetical protein
MEMPMTIRHFVTACAALALLACESSDDDGDAQGGGSAAGGERFFLPTGEPDNTSAPVVEVDAAGGIHLLYPAYAGGGAYYAYCGPDCGGHEDVAVVPLETEGTVANAMLALDGDGHPQVLLAAFSKVYYGSCAGDCTLPGSWTVTPIIDHGSDREVTGEAFALDPQGRPRFLMHTYIAYLGIGQKPPETDWVHCDADCDDPAKWTTSKIADQIWQSTHLRFDADGHAHVATVATVENAETGAEFDNSVYARCDGDCDAPESWSGTGLMPAYESETEAVTVKPAVSLALTRAGAPRVLVLGKNEAGVPNVTYFACDANCATDGWRGTILSESEELGAGLDLALDANDHPRFVYTFDYNIGLVHCDADDCTPPDAPWDLLKVEAGSDIPADDIFLWPNCNVGAWFLHSPSIAITPDGGARVGYQARDISGGWSNPDPTKPACQAGTDMTLSRVALVPKVP